MDASNLLCVTCQQRALNAEREANARGGRPPEIFDKAVVATSTPNRILGSVKSWAPELERSEAVVVEAAYKSSILNDRDSERV